MWEEGVEDYIGRIVEVPELVMDHVAGRVYRVQTESNSHFFAVVGYGRPCFYSAKKAVLEPKKVLSLHRGSILITKMIFNYCRTSIILFIISLKLFANPTDPNVKSGDISIQQVENNLTISQKTDT